MTDIPAGSSGAEAEIPSRPGPLGAALAQALVLRWQPYEDPNPPWPSLSRVLLRAAWGPVLPDLMVFPAGWGCAFAGTDARWVVRVSRKLCCRSAFGCTSESGADAALASVDAAQRRRTWLDTCWWG